MNRRTFLQSTMLAGVSCVAPSVFWAQPDSTQGGTPKSNGIRTRATWPYNRLPGTNDRRNSAVAFSE